MRDLGAVVFVLSCAVGHGREYVSVCGPIAASLISDESAQSPALTFQQFAEEALSCRTISTVLDQDIDRVAVLIHGSPQRRE